jgi:Na+-driven multidrug efflux pump
VARVLGSKTAKGGPASGPNVRASGTRLYDREILRLAAPALGALAAEPLYLLVDTAIVGHLGTPQLAALALASTVLANLVAMCIFLT